MRRIHSCRQASQLVGPKNWIDRLWNSTLERLAVVTRRETRRVRLNLQGERLVVSSQLARAWRRAARPQSGPAGVRQAGRKNLFVPLLHPPAPTTSPQRLQKTATSSRGRWVGGMNQCDQRCEMQVWALSFRRVKMVFDSLTEGRKSLVHTRVFSSTTKDSLCGENLFAAVSFWSAWKGSSGFSFSCAIPKKKAAAKMIS